MEEELQTELKNLEELMQDVLTDHSVPRNVRAIVEEAMQKISGKELK